MSRGSDHRGYEAPIMADAETAFRRLLRFQVKLIVVRLLALHGFDNVSAASTLDRAGLSPGYVRVEHADARVTINRVIDTDPPARTKQKRHSIIRVTFSCGPPQPGFCNA